MEKITATIITHNEERNIRRCLESIKDVVDEIIVVDDFSTDDTENICKEFDVRFVKQKWLGFTEQKNLAISLSSNDWILSIDADEALSEKLKSSILKLKKEETPINYAFSVKILTNYCGHWIHHCGWYPCPKRRLWNRKAGVWFGLIHEYVKFNQSIENVMLDGDLDHYSYYSISQHMMKTDKYSSLSAQKAFEAGKRCRSGFKIHFKTGWTFFNDFFMKLGFLDGYYGYVVCKMNAYGTFLKYSKLRELSEKENN